MRLSLFKKVGAQAKKGVAQTKGMRGKKKAGAGPEERKIGIFGHTKAGKTVFLTMLWHHTHGRRDFSLETDDFQTRQDMSSYFDLLAKGEWPPPTAVERLYRFTAVIDSTIRYPFESQDYQGESVSISSEAEASKKWLDYFQSCDCVFVLVDAEDLLKEGTDAASQRRKKIDSFELMLTQLVEKTRNQLKVPVAIIITKADLLDGFQGDEHVVLVGDSIRYSSYSGYADFMSAVLKQEHVAKHLPWRDQVDHVLSLLKPLVDYCLTKSPDLQVFFISSTGGVDKIETPEGQIITRPPKDLKAIGLQEPFIWSVKLLMQKRRAKAARKLKWWVVGFATTFVLIFSLINNWHEQRIQGVRELYQPGGGSAAERLSNLESYRNHILSGFFKKTFRQQADLILKYTQASAYVDKMNLALDDFDEDLFKESRILMRDLIEQTPRGTFEHGQYTRELLLCETKWDRQYSDQRLENLYAQSKFSELKVCLDNLMTAEYRTEWNQRVETRRTSSYEDKRQEDLDNLINAARNLSGSSWTSLERVKELFGSYGDNYLEDDAASGQWRSIYRTVADCLNLINMTLDNQDNPDELRGLASQFRSLDKIQDFNVGTKLAGYIGNLGKEVTAASAGDAFGSLRGDMERLPLPDRFGDSFVGKLRRFTSQYAGTSEAGQVQSLLRKITNFKANGVRIKVEVSEIATQYHLRIWDDDNNRWDHAEVEPGSPGSLLWKPGAPIKFGLEKDQTENVETLIIEEWAESGDWALFDIVEKDGRHTFGQNFPVTVAFPDLNRELPGL